MSWWSQPGSNRRPSGCKPDALPAELWPLPRWPKVAYGAFGTAPERRDFQAPCPLAEIVETISADIARSPRAKGVTFARYPSAGRNRRDDFGGHHLVARGQKDGASHRGLAALLPATLAPRLGGTISAATCSLRQSGDARPKLTKWWVWEELNLRPHPYQGCALTN
jgi:hypothetical protein